MRNLSVSVIIRNLLSPSTFVLGKLTTLHTRKNYRIIICLISRKLDLHSNY